VIGFGNHKNKKNISPKFHCKTFYIQYDMALQKCGSPQTNYEKEEKEPTLHPLSDLPPHPPKQVDFRP